MQRPFVQTTHGPIRGQLRGGIALFRGIPYGDRCDGERRFLPPQPAESWQQVRDCSGNGPIAVQFGGSISGSEGLGPHFSGGQPEHFGVADERQSENCLVLNVLTRALPDGSAPAPGRRPVLVYIHGGGFTTGSGTLVLGGDRLVQEEDLVLVGIMLLVTACLLTFAGLAKPRTGTITPKNAFIIGLAQALAVLPGLSRSGTTISTGLLLGVQRSEVSKFSFLMVLVPIIGMNLLELIGAPTGGEGIGTWQLVGGFAAAYLTGTLACRWMIRIVNRGKLTWFAVYCAAVGLLSIGFGIFH